jgi:hypothetical protein
MKIDRLVNEMDKLVAPLYSKIGDKIIFQKGDPGNIPFVAGIFYEWDIFQFHTGAYKTMSCTFIGVSPIFFDIHIFPITL